MPSESVKVRVKFGSTEAEVEADISHIREAIDLIPEVLAKLPGQGRGEAILPQPPGHQSIAPGRLSASPGVLPSMAVEKGDSLNDILSKLFSDPWGRSPRRLSEVREALQSYGLNYPKQSVAVALLRSAKSAKIRRFKGDGGEYLYTASTTLMQPAAVEPQVSESEVESSLNV